VLLLQICRVEDVSVKGTITGSVVHFHWVRSVEVESSGVISASGLGILSLSSKYNSHTEFHAYLEGLCAISRL
jgi:hypothetical protein